MAAMAFSCGRGGGVGPLCGEPANKIGGIHLCIIEVSVELNMYVESPFEFSIRVNEVIVKVRV
jgi:hypothetical protein